MRTCVVGDNQKSWFVPFARRLVKDLGQYGESELLLDADAIPSGNDVAFLLSYERKVPLPILARSQHNVVVHASALPLGKGMSPMTWQILEGKSQIPVTLFEAVEALDSGPIYMRDAITFKGDEVLSEMRDKLGTKIVEMCMAFVREYEEITERGQPQTGPGTRYRTRTPEDSRLDPGRSIAEQFDLLRVVDNDRYPAFFELRGRRYILTITPAKDHEP